MLVSAEFRQHLSDAFYPRRPEWAGAFLLVLGGWILRENPTLMEVSQTGTTKPFTLMLAVASQPAWASALLAFGLLRFLVLFINGAWRKSPHLRMLFALLSCFFWEQIALSFSATFGLSFAAYVVFLGLEFSNIIIAGRDARAADDAARRST